jgi:hypothetical protein
MRDSRVKGGIRFLNVAAILLGALTAIRAARGNLIFTEQVAVTEVQGFADDDIASAAKLDASAPLAVGDLLTISYEISQPSLSSGDDIDSVVYENVHAAVKFGADDLFTTDKAELTVWNLIGFYGIAVTDFSGPLLDFLASSSPDVISKGFLAPGLLIADFDSAAGGSVFANGQVIGFQTVSYQFSGDLPVAATPVPEPAAYGAAAGLALLALVFGKRLRNRDRR